MWLNLLRQLGYRDRDCVGAVEEASYALAAHEVASQNLRPGLVAKAFSDAEGDEAKAKAIYLRLRATQIADELQRELATLKVEEERQVEEARKATCSRCANYSRSLLDRVAGGGYGNCSLHKKLVLPSDRCADYRPL